LRFQGHDYEDVTLQWSHYATDPRNIIPALRLMVDDGYGPEPLAVATVNLPDVGPDEGCIFVKDWSENEGLWDALIASGVVEDMGVYVEVNQWGSKAHQGYVLPPYDEDLRKAIERGLSLG
jgi:hypothetical protein